MPGLRRARRLGIGILLLALGACGPRDRQVPVALVGRWQGRIAWRDAETPVALEIAAEGDSLTAVLDAPDLGLARAPIGRVSFDSPRVHFAIPGSRDTVAFDGWFRRGVFTGALSSSALGRGGRTALLPQLAMGRPPGRPHLPGVVADTLPVARTSAGSPDTLVAWLHARAEAAPGR